MASPVVIPGPGSVRQVGVARDPGHRRATGGDFGAGVGNAIADLGATATAIGAKFYQERKAIEDDILEQRDELEASTLAQKAYLGMQGEAGVDPDNFHARVGETLNAGFAELDKKYANEGIRISDEARRRMTARRGNLLQNYTLRGVTDGHNARVVDLGRTVETNLSQVGTQLATDGDITAASDRATAALGSLSKLVDPAEMEKARLKVNRDLGASVVSYLNTLQDEAVSAETDEERNSYVVQGHALIDQAVSKGWIDAADGANAKRDWERDYQIRVFKSNADDPQEQRRMLGDVAAGQQFSGNGATVARQLLYKFENPQGNPWLTTHWDTNHHRIGYSSDTITEVDGTVRAVRQGDTITKEDAERDLTRRIHEASADAARMMGADVWGKIGPAAQGALISVAYNYGTLPASVVEAAKTGDRERLARAVADLSANKDRRQQEAAIIRGGTDVSMSAHGPEGGDSFFTSMPEDVRQQLIAQARSNQGRASEEYVNGVEDYLAFLRAGNTPDGRYSTQELTYQLGPERGAEVAEEVQAAIDYGEDVAAVRMASPEEVQAIIASRQAALGSPEGFRENAGELAGIAKAVQERNTAIASDPAGYVATYDDRTKAAYDAMQVAPSAEQPAAASRYAAATLGAQQMLGVPSSMQTILPKPAVADIAEQFRAQPEGGQNAAQLMASLEDTWGKNYPKVFAQLASDGNLPGPAIVVGTMNRPGQELAASQLAEAAAMGADALKKSIPDTIAKEIDDGDAGVPAWTEDLAASLAFNGQSGVSTYNAFNESVRLLAMYYAFQGDGNSSSALRRATNEIINKAYSFEEFHGQTMRIPIEYDAGDIAGGAQDALRALNPADLTIPMSAMGLSDEQVREAYGNAVKANGFWVTNDDETGLTLRASNGDTVLRADGTRYSLTWGEVQAASFTEEEIKRGGATPAARKIYRQGDMSLGAGVPGGGAAGVGMVDTIVPPGIEEIMSE